MILCNSPRICTYTFVERGGGYILGGGGVDSGRVAYCCWKGECILGGGEGRFWQGRTYKLVEKGGWFWKGWVDSGRVAHINWLKRGVFSGREGWILGGLHIVVEKGRYVLGGRGSFLDGRTYTFVEKKGYILGGRGIFCYPKTPHQITKRGVDPGMEG